MVREGQSVSLMLLATHATQFSATVQFSISVHTRVITSLSVYVGYEENWIAISHDHSQYGIVVSVTQMLRISNRAGGCRLVDSTSIVQYDGCIQQESVF